MTRLLIHVEGQTEESFVNNVLRPHLYGIGYSRVNARLIGNSRQRSKRGGIRPWTAARRDIVNHLNTDAGCITSTMVDYYALPQNGDKAWPGRAEAGNLPFSDKAYTIENALLSDVSNLMGNNFNETRFVPYVMMHEFEAILFSDCERFARGIGRHNLAPQLQQIRDRFDTPEEIDDSPETAPSKRIETLVRGYEKPLHGTLAAQEIGLNSIRRECPHFGEWLGRLERLATLGRV